MLLHVLLAPLVLAGAARARLAFVSTLTSDSFTLAARVLARSLQSFHPDIEFLLLYTQDVSAESVAQLARQQNIRLRAISKLDTPYLPTHTARKFQYTKIRLWSLVEYEALVHLDLDTLLVAPVGELFACGRFCASLRHSDMFNSGVFVLRPSQQVFADMMRGLNATPSYDGGDQGFLNSFFPQLKFAGMFRPNQSAGPPIQRLSAAYNYDVGVYYLRGRALVQPKIIHYTLGFVKPWFWFSYPLFDLNWQWLRVRLQVHREFDAVLQQQFGDLLRLLLMLGALALLQLATPLLRRLAPRRLRKPGAAERGLVTAGVALLGLASGFAFTSTQVLPQLGWLYFTLHQSFCMACLCSLYARCRFGGGPFGLCSFVPFLLGLCAAHLAVWLTLLHISSPPVRFAVFLGAAAVYGWALLQAIGLLLFWDGGKQKRGAKAQAHELESLTTAEAA